MHLGLGHARLSIIDLSPTGHQPITHRASGDVLVYNGEIYNYRELRSELEKSGDRFQGSSDSEVLLLGLSRFGASFVDRLQGMFAFAFFSKVDQTILLARDPLGIKPLYFARLDETLVFASEIQGILASGLVPRELNRRGMAGYLAYGAVPAPETIVKNVELVPSGTTQTWSVSDRRLQSRSATHWTIPDVDTTPQADISDRLRATLERAVARHLVSDVPVGLFLSSGIDSTILAGIASKQANNVRSFTVGFEDCPSMSEFVPSRETAKIFGLQHSEITINGSDAIDLAVCWLQSLDQPSIDGLNVYAISKVVRDEGIKVAISGQGGDELFAGYSSFVYVPRLYRFLRAVSWLPRGARRWIVNGLAWTRADVQREKLRDIARTDGSVLELYLQRRRVMSDRQLTHLGLVPADMGLCPNYLSNGSLARLATDPNDIVASVSRFESHLYQENMLLRDSDTNGMTHGLEIRVPMLDREMIDLVYKTPGKLRLPRADLPKHLLKTSCASLLRPDILGRGKMGFSLPIAQWMLGPMRDICEDSLRTLESQSILDPRGVRDVWQQFLANPSTSWSRALALCVLGAYVSRLRSPTEPLSVHGSDRSNGR